MRISQMGCFCATYRDEVERSVSVDARGILEALRNIYGAKGLVEELVGPAAPPSREAK